jgi:NitT/TauT family transport system substrate-binding protein
MRSRAGIEVRRPASGRRFRHRIGFGVAAVTAATSLTAGLAMVGVATSSAADRAATTVTVRTDYYGTGFLAPFYVALHFGYYAKAGLNVTIKPGTGSSTTVKETAAGKNDIGIASAPIIALGEPSDHNNLVSFCGYIQKPPDAIISLKTHPIEKATQLYGTKVGYPIGGESVPWPAFVAAAHLKDTKITRVGLSFSDYLSALASGKVTSIIGWGISQGVEENAIKPIAKPLLYSSYGVNMLSESIFATRGWLSAHGQAAKSFLKATIKGIKWSLSHKTTALEIEKTYTKTMTVKLSATYMAQLHKFLQTSNSQGHSYCWTSPKDVLSTQTVLDKYDSLPRSVKLVKLVTNKYVPSGS